MKGRSLPSPSTRWLLGGLAEGCLPAIDHARTSKTSFICCCIREAWCQVLEHSPSLMHTGGKICCLLGQGQTSWSRLGCSAPVLCMLGHRFGCEALGLYSSGKLQLSLSGAGAAGTCDRVCKKSPGAGAAALCCAGTTVFPNVSLNPRTYPVYLQTHDPYVIARDNLDGCVVNSAHALQRPVSTPGHFPA